MELSSDMQRKIAEKIGEDLSSFSRLVTIYSNTRELCYLCKMLILCMGIYTRHNKDIHILDKITIFLEDSLSDEGGDN